MSKASVPDYKLPSSLIGHAELGRLLREVETIDGELQAQKVRGKAPSVQESGLSQGFSDFIEQNDIDATDSKALMALKEHLRVIKDRAPVVHLTFATDVDGYELQKLVSWLREEVHPYALVTIGLQPSLVGGVYMRTPNKVYDFSVKALLKGKRDIIIHELEALHAG